MESLAHVVRGKSHSKITKITENAGKPRPPKNHHEMEPQDELLISIQPLTEENLCLFNQRNPLDKPAEYLPKCDDSAHHDVDANTSVTSHSESSTLRFSKDRSGSVSKYAFAIAIPSLAAIPCKWFFILLC